MSIKKDNKQKLFEMMEKLNPDLQKKRLNEIETKRDIEFGEDDLLAVVFYGDCRMEDIGIGSYEFWGSRGHDKRMVARCENIKWNSEDFTDEENMVIQNYFDENQHEIQEEIEEKYEDMGGDDAFR